MADTSDGDSNTNSVSSFISSLVFNLVVAVAIAIAFCILRPHFKRVYAPRTYSVEKSKRSPPIGSGLLSWIPAVLNVPDDKVIKRVGLDAYMLLRSMRSLFIIFTVLSVLSLITILPANIKGGDEASGLAHLSIGNVDKQSRLLWIHIVFFMVFVVWVLSMMLGEFKVYSRLRIWWLTSPEHTSTAGANTVLVSSLPDCLVNRTDRLESTFSVFPGGVRKLIVNRNMSALADIVAERDADVLKLESLLTKYAVMCEKESRKAAKKGLEYHAPKRPLMRLGKVPLIGKKVDAISHYTAEITRLNKEIVEAHDGNGDDPFKKQSSAFVMFNKQYAAHMAAQCTLDYIPFSMNSVSLDVNADDVIWENLNMNPYDRRIRGYISFAISIGLVIGWSALNTFVQSLVQVEKLKSFGPFKDMSDSKFIGVFSGIIPSVITAVLMALLPIFLRLLLKLEGTPLISEIELSLLHRYYFFQVWVVYIVTIFMVAILSTASESVGDVTEIAKIIHEKVPESATNILTYVLLLCFTGAAKELLQMTPLALRYILPMLFAKTPRALNNAEKPATYSWGTEIPVHSLIFLMGFSYSFIQPLINCFVAVYFALYYIVYRYQFLYVYSSENWQTGGLSFPKFIKQLLVAVYISEVYLLLMMVAKINSSANAIIRIVFSALILLATIGYHKYINEAYMPIVNYLPARKVAEIDAKPELASKPTNFYSSDPFDDDDGSNGKSERRMSHAEQKSRNKIYAAYGSFVPTKFIEYLIKKIPNLVIPPASVTPDSASEERDTEGAATGAAASIKKNHRNDSAHYAESGQSRHSNVRPSRDTTEVIAVEPNASASVHENVEIESTNDVHSAIYSVDSKAELRRRQQQLEETEDKLNGNDNDNDNGDTALRHRSNHMSLHADANDRDIEEAFTNPAFKAKPVCSVWVPMDNNRLCRDIYEEVARESNGSINVVVDGTWITEKCKVQAEVDFDIEKLSNVDEKSVRGD